MKKQGNTVSTMKRLLHHIKKYIGYMMLSILLALVCVGLTLYVPIMIGHAIDYIVVGKVEFNNISVILIQIIVVVGITALLQWLMNIINNKVTFQVVRDIREEAFSNLQRLPLCYMDTHPQGEVLSRIISDVDQFADGLLMGFTQLFTGVMTIVGTLGFMISINVKISLVVVLVTPLSLLVANFIAKKSYRMFQLQSETRGKQTAFIDEMIGNAKVVKAFGHEEESLEEFDKINGQLKEYSLKAIFVSSLSNPAARFVNGIVYALVGLTGAFYVISGGMTVGVLSCFLSYANQYTKPFNEISSVVTELQNALACAKRIFELIEEKPEEQAPDVIQLSTVKGEVVCKEVAFSYSKDKTLIQNFNLEVEQGQTVAIVGPTGCGKTTLINLLMRFYEMDEGQITVDGKEIREVTRHSLRKSYGMVLQDTWLKEGTILDNILLGKPEATKEEVIEAAKNAHAHSFIRRLPNGYNTIIGEDGGTLSVGQKQLLSIARVMLCLPPMLILDEATSSIDTRTEIKIQEAFAKMMKGRTSFIVAHRLSTIQNADRILVMKEGNIVEQGNHEELLKQKGFYYELYHSMSQ